MRKGCSLGSWFHYFSFPEITHVYVTCKLSKPNQPFSLRYIYSKVINFFWQRNKTHHMRDVLLYVLHPAVYRSPQTRAWEIFLFQTLPNLQTNQTKQHGYNNACAHQAERPETKSTCNPNETSRPTYGRLVSSYYVPLTSKPKTFIKGFKKHQPPAAVLAS